MPTPAKLKELGKPLWDITRKYEMADQVIREAQLRLWKKGKYYFSGDQLLYWDSQALDYRSITDSPLSNIGVNSGSNPAVDDFYTKCMNIFRAHGESVIAVLSNEMPSVQFFPENAESADDVSTARNYSEVVKLIEIHNKNVLLMMKALYLLWTQGFLAGYSYSHASHKYGSVKKIKNKIQKTPVDKYYCPQCQNEINIEDPNVLLEESTDSTRSGESEIFYQSQGGMGQGDPNAEESTGPMGTCQICKYKGPVTVENLMMEEEVFDKFIYDPKCRTIQEVYGGTHVKVLPHATCQADTPYLILEFETDRASMRMKYKEVLKDAGTGNNSEVSYERNTRDINNFEEINEDQCTVKYVWLRPCAFYRDSVEEGDELSRLYPKGSFACFVDSMCCEIREEDLDDHWAIAQSPISDHIHADPLGKPLYDIQDIQNELLNLTLHKVEQGIEDTFADPSVLDFDKFNEVERTPGMYFPAKPAPGASLSDAFYKDKGAQISQELGVFSDKLDQLGQMLVGAMPSVWGGNMPGGSKTAHEYETSKQQALQRLNISWKFLNVWYAEFMFCGVKNYVAHMQDVETYAMKQGDSYLNIKLIKDTMKGRIGRVEPESSSAFPLSWSEKRASVLDLIKMNNDEINQALFAPENAEMIHQLSGIPELVLPDADSRLKQYREIQQIIASGQPPTQGPEGEFISSIQIDPDLDDHRVEASVLRSFLISPYGQDLKEDSQEIYQNLLAHYKAHKEQVDLAAAQAQQKIAQMTPKSNRPVSIGASR